MIIREDMADIRVSINGTSYFGSWTSYEGAGLTAQDAKTRTGGMGAEVAVGGPATRGDLTLTIQWSDIVAAYHNELESYVGMGALVCAIQYLNPDRSIMQNARFTVYGIVKGAERPKSDANGSAVTFYTVTASLNQIAA